MGIMDKKLETTIVYEGYTGYGKRKWNLLYSYHRVVEACRCKCTWVLILEFRTDWVAAKDLESLDFDMYA